MTRLFDGKNILTISMYENDGPDWSEDFFSVGGCEYNEGLDAYRVPDVAYSADQAHDWLCKIGDFVDDADNMPDAVREVDAKTEPLKSGYFLDFDSFDQDIFYLLRIYDHETVYEGRLSEVDGAEDDWQDALDRLFERELGILPNEWEVG